MIIDPDHNLHTAVWGLTPWCRTPHSSAWCLLKSPFGCVACEANWVRLWCGLKPTTGWVGSKASCKGLWCSSMQGAACDRFWATLLELQSNLLFMPASAWAGCVLEGPSYIKRLASTSTEQSLVSKRFKTPQGPPLPSSCLLGSVNKRAYGNMQITQGRFSVSCRQGWVGFTKLIQVQPWCPCWGAGVWDHSVKVSGYTKAIHHLLGTCGHL